jgi:hypothetical protein
MNNITLRSFVNEFYVLHQLLLENITLKLYTNIRRQ